VTIRNETEFIQNYLVPLTRGAAGTFGLKDDAAIIPVPDGHDLVVTTDAVASGTHFMPEQSPADIAWKAVAVNVSDLVAKGAKPVCYQMSVAFDNAPGNAWVESFVRGLDEVQSAFDLYLAGGDTDVRRGPLTITITAFGVVPTNRMIRRSTAQTGDKLYVSGTIGDSMNGLLMLQDPSAATKFGLSRDIEQSLINRYLRPQPRIELLAALREHASAAMDISDGLGQDLAKLAAASGVGAIMSKHRDRLPLVAHASDDYEILAAIPPGQANSFEAAARKAGVAVQCIGTLTETTAIQFLDSDGATLDVSLGGWDHFRDAR
jgi:thiamine-monophosphate kinase